MSEGLFKCYGESEESQELNEKKITTKNFYYKKLLIIYDHSMVDHIEDMKCFCCYHNYSSIIFGEKAFYLGFAMIQWRINKYIIEQSDPQQMLMSLII